MSSSLSGVIEAMSIVYFRSPELELRAVAQNVLDDHSILDYGIGEEEIDDEEVSYKMLFEKIKEEES